MIYLTLCTILGIILISLGLLMLYRIVMNRLDELERSLDKITENTVNARRDIHVLKEREAAKSDKVVITSDLPEPKPAIKYGGF